MDDGTIGALFTSTKLPSVNAIATAVTMSGHNRRGLPAKVVADAVSANVAKRDADPNALPPMPVASPLKAIKSRRQLRDVAKVIVKALKHAVEDQGYWRELWRGDKPAPERSCQAAFKLLASGWCRAHDIDLSPETNIGRGPVDFKLANGWESRALIEIKLASNSKFWRGLNAQLPQYMKSEGINSGFFVAFAFDDAEQRLVTDVVRAAERVSARTGYEITAITIDARRDNKLAASKL